MRKTRKYPFMFGSKRKKKFDRKRSKIIPTCFSCVSEPICINL